MKYHNTVIDCLFLHILVFLVSLPVGILWAILLWGVIDPRFVILAWWLAFSKVAYKRQWRIT
jgi:hypothetical protein